MDWLNSGHVLSTDQGLMSQCHSGFL